MKKYFLFFSRHPITYNVIFFGPAFIVTVLLSVGGYISFNPLSTNGAMIFFGAILAHTSLVCVVTWLYITRSYSWLNEPFRCLFTILVVSDKSNNISKIVLKKSVWGKGTKYFIEKPENYWSANDHEGLSVNTRIIGEYGNLSVATSVTIKVKSIKGGFDKIKVFNNLLPHADINDITNLNLEKYVVQIFHDFNPDSRGEINDLSKQYVEQTISPPMFLEKLSGIIKLPKEEIFPNIESVDITLGEPSFASAVKTGSKS